MTFKEIIKEYSAVIPVARWLCAGLIVLLFVFNLFPPHFVDEWLAGSWWGRLCGSFYNGIEGNPWLGWFFAVSFGLLSIITGIGLVRHKQSWYVRLAVAMLIIWIVSDPFWTYGSIEWNGDIRWIIAFCLLLVFLGTSFRIKVEEVAPDRGESSVTGFTADSNMKNRDRILPKYAAELTSKLLETDVKKSSFAVGIEGGWGTGKTTFLNYIRDSLPQNAIVMEFNPWLSLSDRSLVKAYFNSLAQIVSENLDKELFSPLRKYGDALASLDGVGGWLEVLKNFLVGVDRHDVHTLKAKISDKLSQLDRKLFVVIDDMDRLDQDELFEVLRLIRNTADFPGIVYVVAYDKSYVVDQLSNRGIRKAEIYLEKIFNLEINLPKTLNKVLQQVLFYELVDMLPEAEYAGIDYPVETINDILHNYREVKRFAREFSFSMSFMTEQVGLREFNVANLFILGLIKYYDHELYADLKDNVGKLLQSKKLLNGVAMLELKAGLKQDDFAHENSLKLLQLLFDEKYRTDTSIGYTVNYPRYFTCAIDNDILRKETFEQWLLCADGEEQSKWDELRSRHQPKSLMFQFGMCRTATLTADRLKRFVVGLLRIWSSEVAYDRNVQAILVEAIDKENAPQLDERDFFEWFKTAIAPFQTEERLYVSASQLYNRLKTTLRDDVSRIDDLERDNLKRYLTQFTPDAIDIQRSKTSLSLIYSNSLVWKNHYYGFDETTGEPYVEKLGSTAIFDILLEHFKKHPSAKKEQFIDEMFYYDEPGDGDEVYRAQLDEEECEHQIRTCFGQKQYYTAFVQSAFRSKVED